MVTIHTVPNLKEAIELIINSIETGDTSSLDAIQAEALIRKIDKLRTQYNDQLNSLRDEYGPKLAEAMQKLNDIISRSQNN